MLKRSSTAVSLLAAVAVMLAGCSSTTSKPPYAKSAKVDCGGKQTLTASGSTAQANAMAKFISAYQKACPNQTLNYTSNGSGAGIADFLANKTDFAGSDSALSADQYAPAKQRCGSDVWNLPVVFGPIAITYHVSGVGHLILDAPTLAKIFSGASARWDDPAISALNGNMPAADIHRSDDSGTTDNFQPYLQAASGGAWTKRVGKTFHGGVGTGAPGNEGTSAAVKTTDGAITYNEWSFALQQRLSVSDIKTSAGPDPVHVGRDSVGKTIAGAKVAGQGNDLVLDLSSFYTPTERGLYPIVLVTYEIVCSKYADPQVGNAIKTSLQSTIGPGQSGLAEHGHIPLPTDFQSKVAGAVNAIT